MEANEEAEIASANKARGGLAAYLSRPDVSQDRARLVTRRIRFELEQRFQRHPAMDRIVCFDRDLQIGVRISEKVGRSIYFYGIFEFRVATLFKRLVRPGMVVYDVGAHVGQYTLLASKRVGSEGKVVAVEPNPENLVRLEANITLNRFENVTVLRVALSNEEGRLAFCVPDGPDRTALGSLLPSGGAPESFTVNVRRLDAIAPTTLDVIKIDVEGVEDRVIAGGVETLSRTRPAVIFEVFVDAAPQRPISRLRDLGYRIFGIGENGVLHELPEGADPESYREPCYALNLVALHPDSPAWRSAFSG
jgi:FkbM family methyltransferase